MWPRLPYLVASSTGLNHMMSSAEKGPNDHKKAAKQTSMCCAHTARATRTDQRTSVEKHVANHGRAFVDLEGMAAQGDFLGDNSVRVDFEQRAGRHECVANCGAQKRSTRAGLEQNGQRSLPNMGWVIT